MGEQASERQSVRGLALLVLPHLGDGGTMAEAGQVVRLATEVLRLVDPRDLLGLAEVATMAGARAQTVTNWRARYPDFPEPVCRLRAGPVFRRCEIRAWLDAHGRMSDS